MQVDKAVRLVNELRRYRYAKKTGRETVWDQSKGTHIIQTIIPRVPKSVANSVYAIVGVSDRSATMTFRTEIIDPHDCWSTQRSLRIWSLRWQLRNFDKMQASSVLVDEPFELKIPIMFWFNGKYVIWNGNHRTTAALLLGRRLRCKVYRLKGKSKP